MQHVDDFEPFIPDPIEHSVTRPYEIATQTGSQLSPWAAAKGEQCETIEARHNAVNCLIGGVRIFHGDGRPNLCHFDLSGGR